MSFQNNHIRKTVSAGLLIVLLLIHSVKLLHTHTYSHNGSGDTDITIEKNFSPEGSSLSNDCGICSYQLTKDADDLVYPGIATRIDVQSKFIDQPVLFSQHSFLSVFETRGPPAIVWFVK